MWLLATSKNVRYDCTQGAHCHINYLDWFRTKSAYDIIIIPVEEGEWLTVKPWNRQNLQCVFNINHVSSTEALSSTCNNWLARNWSSQNSQGEVYLHGMILDSFQHEELHFTFLLKLDSCMLPLQSQSMKIHGTFLSREWKEVNWSFKHVPSQVLELKKYQQNMVLCVKRYINPVRLKHGTTRPIKIWKTRKKQSQCLILIAGKLCFDVTEKWYIKNVLSFHSSMCQNFTAFYNLVNICIQLLCINILLMMLVSLKPVSSFPTFIPCKKCMPSSSWRGYPVVCNLVVRRHSSVNVDPHSLTAHYL